MAGEVMAKTAQYLTKSLTIRYVAVLAVIGLLVIGSFLGLIRALMDAQADTSGIAAAGRQRLAVERIATLAKQLAEKKRGDASGPLVERDLHLWLDRLESVHTGLLAGFPEVRLRRPPSERVRRLYFGPDAALDQSVRTFVQHGRGLLAGRLGESGFFHDLQAVTAAATGDLAADLDRVDEAYRQEGTTRLRHMFGYLSAVIAAVLFLLVLSAALVFRPLVSRLRIDIAERIRIEKKLRESEEKLWRLLQESPVGVSASRRSDGIVVFANARFCEILRTHPQHVLGCKARDLYVDERQLAQTISALKGSGVINDAEVEFRRSDGTPFRSLLTIRASHFEGEPVNLAWIYDISAIKAAEEQLKLTAKVVESASEAVVITNAQNDIEYVNPAFSAITEYSAAEVIGRNPALWRSGRHDQEFYQNMWTEIKAAGRWRGEIWNRRKSGEFYAEWLSIVAIRDESGHISHHIAIFSDITHRKEDEARVWRQANFDALTGLPNRALFIDRLGQAIRQSKREGKKFALFFIDLDGFKSVNDSLGHAAGDLLLQQSASRLVDCVRASDTVARLAGDEFTCIVEGVHHRADASEVARKILESLAHPYDLDGREAHIRGSVGIAIYPDDADEGDELLKLADAAMYQVKRRGKNNFEFAG